MMISYMTQEGCKVVMARHGRGCWRLQPMCLENRRWRFKSPSLLHLCCIAHFSYCSRPDKTRNLVVDGSKCANTYPICCGTREECGEQFRQWYETLSDVVCDEVEEECLVKCFGVEAEEQGTFFSLERIEYCCYHRCDNNWRCAERNCTFQKSPRPTIIYEEGD